MKLKKLLVAFMAFSMLFAFASCNSKQAEENGEGSDYVDIYEKSNYGEDIEILTEKERAYLLCDSFVSEVNSGGLESYFTTDYSKFCLEAAEYLENNNSVIYPQVLREAISLFPESFDFSDPIKTEEYLDENESILEKFDELDSKIYDSDEDIDSILEKLKEETYNDR